MQLIQEKLVYYGDFFNTYFSYYIDGTIYTLALSLISVIGGGLVALFIATGSMSSNKFFKGFSNVYIKVIRGTPLMVQLIMVYYGLYSVGIQLNDFVSGTLVLSLNSGAYVSEIIRSGIQAVDKGQFEAARSLGLNHKQTMRKIIYPQAIKNILPAIGNELASLIKETSIVSVVGLRDLMFEANLVRGRTFMPFTPVFLAAVIYFVLTTIVSTIVSRIERRLASSD